MQFERLSLTALHPRSIWVAWKEVRRGANAKPTKVPQDPKRRGTTASADNPATWGPYAAASALAKLIKLKGNGGVGIILGDLSDGTHLCGIDLDSCYNPATQESEQHVSEIIDRFDGAYCEISPSGHGVKLYFRLATVHLPLVRAAMGRSKDGKLQHGRTWARGEKQEVALHVSNRYFAYTGQGYGQDPDICREVGTDDGVGVVGLSAILWLINEAGPDYKSGKKKERDLSGSGVLFRLAMWIKAAGGTINDFEQAIDEVPEAAAHVQDNGDRSVHRAWGNSPDHDLDSSIQSGKNEDGIIRAFTIRHSNELRFDHSAGKWFRFTGSHWSPENTKLALDFARAAAIEMIADGAESSTLRQLKRVSTWEAVERGARSVREFAVTSEIWDRDPFLLGTPDGPIDLKTGILKRAQPQDYVSKVTAVPPVPLDVFDAARDCPTWLAFLDVALAADNGAIRLLQQWGGYNLTGVTTEQVLVFVYGPGGSGKGTAINTIGDILGAYGITVGMETLTASKHDRHTTELARLKGARMARASETEKGRHWAENRIKNLTGQDPITARFMRQDDFEFVPEFKLTIFGNNRPSLRDVDTAIKRRFIVFPFDHPPQKGDADLQAKLRKEWPGILSWLIKGCLDWQTNGLMRPKVVQDATDAYFEQEDTFGRWLEDCCEVSPRLAATVEDLWDSWNKFAWSLGEDPGTKNKFFPETLSQRGFEAIKDTGGIRGRGYRGLRPNLSQEGLDADDLV